jgi:hypothetical protein
VKSVLPRALAAHATPPSSFRSFSVIENVPPEDYQDGHLITDHLEYLDDMIGKTLEIEDHMERLKQTYAEKRQAFQEAKSADEIEALFLKAEAQKYAISQQVAELRRSLMHRKAFAVDGPDGTSDELDQLYLEEAQSVINDAAKKTVK